MAVLIEIRVDGTRGEHDAADTLVSEAIEGGGGPPPGLMFHLSWPDGAGFVMVDVWRTEEEARPFLRDVVLPALAQAGLREVEPAVRPVWRMARPPGL